MKLDKYDPNEIIVRSTEGAKQDPSDPKYLWDGGGPSDEAWRRFRRMILDEHNMDVTGVATENAWMLDDFYRMLSEYKARQTLERWRNRPRG